MERELLTARLVSKKCLAESMQFFHFEIDCETSFHFTPGQFISVVIERERDGRIRQETRAYSLAAAPLGSRIELAFNRVDGGFFSNYLCDLEPGAILQFHGPHGTFVLRNPLEDSIILVESAGIVPIRAMLQKLQPSKAFVHLVHSAPGEESLLYRDEFAANPAIEYHPVTINALEEAAKILDANPQIKTAYVVGLSEFVNRQREQLKARGWDRKQIVFERYD